MKNQRAAYHKLFESAAGREGKDDVKKTTAVITADQIKLLTDVGFQWKLKPDHADAWKSYFERIKAYKEEHGHTEFSLKENKTLQQWVSKQRQRYRQRAQGENNPMTDQIALLEGIGFDRKRRGRGGSALGHQPRKKEEDPERAEEEGVRGGEDEEGEEETGEETGEETPMSSSFVCR